MTKIEPKKSIFDSNKKHTNKDKQNIKNKRKFQKDQKKDKTMSKTLFNAQRSVLKK
jgi:hypothetical protein